jgi:hypothetical protein
VIGVNRKVNLVGLMRQMMAIWDDVLTPADQAASRSPRRWFGLEKQAQDVPAASSDPLFSTFGEKFGIWRAERLKVTHFDPLIHLQGVEQPLSPPQWSLNRFCYAALVQKEHWLTSERTMPRRPP